MTMTRPFTVQMCAVVLAAVLAAAPPALACSQCCTVCGPFCTQVFYDNYFDEECWDLTGSAQIVTINGNNMAQMDGMGSVSQVVTQAVNNDLKFDVEVVTGNDPGSDRLVVEVVSTSGTLLDTLDTIYSSGTYTYDVGAYSSQSAIRIRLRMISLPYPGDTIYRIDNAYFWIYPN
jgi:hypothetical protein